MLKQIAIGMLSPFVGTMLSMGTIGDRIREAREAKGWTKAELARQLKVEPPTISQLESGETKSPSSENLLRLRDLGINPDFIMRGKGPKLLEDIEKKLKTDTLMSMIGELDESEADMVADVVKGIIRRKGGGSPNDPFKTDPPKTNGTQ